MQVSSAGLIHIWKILAVLAPFLSINYSLISVLRHPQGSCLSQNSPIYSQVAVMSNGKLYRHEIIFYGVAISVAFLIRVLFPFELRDGIFLILSIFFYWFLLTAIVQFGCYLGYFNLVSMFSTRPSNVPKDRHLSPLHFAATTSSIITAFTIERIYSIIENSVVVLILIFPIFLATYKLTWLFFELSYYTHR